VVGGAEIVKAARKKKSGRFARDNKIGKGKPKTQVENRTWGTRQRRGRRMKE
jgi:hypothetical protein